MAVLKPQIQSIQNGLLTVTVLSPSIVTVIFNQIKISKSSSSTGPFSEIGTIDLSGQTDYTFLDAFSGPEFYYRAQFFNSGTMVSSQFSDLAQEQGTFTEFTVPLNLSSYPPEIALTVDDREIVESIRAVLGDFGSIERDFFDSSNPQTAFSCAEHISRDGCTWELSEPKGWPAQIYLNGILKTNLFDPQVIGYRYLTFSGASPCITGTLDIYYSHFRFSDREILLAYARSVNFLTSCMLTTEQITKEMKVIQTAILLLEGEIRGFTSGQAIRIRDGDTEYDSSRAIESRSQDLRDLQRRLDDLIKCANWNASYHLEGVRID